MNLDEIWSDFQTFIQSTKTDEQIKTELNQQFGVQLAVMAKNERDCQEKQRLFSLAMKKAKLTKQLERMLKMTDDPFSDIYGIIYN